MPDPTWPSSPPEANYLRLAGPGVAGTATTTACAAAWQALAVSDELAASVSTLNTATTALDFEGVGGGRSAATAGGLNTALHLLAGWAQEKPPIAATAVAAYQSAVSSMIPAAVSMANRAEQAADVALNPLVFGALTPAIVALDTVYFGEHWPQNAAAGAAYGSALAVLVGALAVPPPLSPPGASPLAAASAASAAVQSTGRVAGEAVAESGRLIGDSTAAPAEAAGQAGPLGSMTMQPIQAAAGALQPMAGMFQAPLQAFQGLAGLPQSLLGGFPGSPAERPGSPTGILGAAGLPTAAVGGGGAPGVSPGGGSAGPTAVGGGGSGAGLTSFSRPNGSFPAENGGRPVGLKGGLLSSADTRGLTTSVGSAMTPAPAGMLGSSKDRETKDDTPQARIVLPGSEPRNNETS